MAYRRIHNKGLFQHDEYKAGGAVTPGMLCAINAAGNAIAHDVAEIQCPVLLAEEDALQGNEVADAYASGSVMMVMVPNKGTICNVLVASGESLAIGDTLCSAGDGTFIKVEAATSGTLNAGALVESTETVALLTANTLVACRVL